MKFKLLQNFKKEDVRMFSLENVRVDLLSTLVVSSRQITFVYEPKFQLLILSKIQGY